MGDEINLKCKSCGVIKRYDMRREFDVKALEDGHCVNCGKDDLEYFFKVNYEKISPDAYVFHDNCYICGKQTLVSRGTGCCAKCNGDA